MKHIFIDTPGQIEVFTWSASGMIITEALALQHPTVLIYVVDTPRTTNPTTFMSNMLYACSILYKTGLPLVVVFNKSDVTSADFALEWMKDYDKFQEAMDALNDQTYMTSLNRSMALVLDEFYSNLRSAVVSAATGEGIEELMATIEEARKEYMEDYLPALLERKAAAAAQEKARQEENLSRLTQDMKLTDKKTRKDSDGGQA